jgi:flagellum-specific peptidoglycan hydrolase FlgJ
VVQKLGFSGFAVFVQAAHETADFTRICGEFNFWGLKVPHKIPWSGKIIELWTHEYTRVLPGETQDKALVRLIKLWGVNNIKIERQEMNKGVLSWYFGIPQEFIDFPDASQALAYYASHVQRNFSSAYANRTDPMKFYEGLMNGKLQWATDPGYVKSLKAKHAELLKCPALGVLIGEAVRIKP